MTFCQVMALVNFGGWWEIVLAPYHTCISVHTLNMNRSDTSVGNRDMYLPSKWMCYMVAPQEQGLTSCECVAVFPGKSDMEAV